jgi:hypothetical protein
VAYKKTAWILDPAVEDVRRESLASIGLYVGGSAPYAVEPKLSRVRSRLDSTGPGNPWGSLDLSGQRHICRMDASPNEDPVIEYRRLRLFVKPNH